MDLGKRKTCENCGKTYALMLEKHSEQDCIEHLKAKLAKVVEWLDCCHAEDCQRRAMHACPACAALVAAKEGL